MQYEWFISVGKYQFDFNPKVTRHREFKGSETKAISAYNALKTPFHGFKVLWCRAKRKGAVPKIKQVDYHETVPQNVRQLTDDYLHSLLI